MSGRVLHTGKHFMHYPTSSTLPALIIYWLQAFEDLHPDSSVGPKPVEPHELEDVDVSRIPTSWQVSLQPRYDDLPDIGDGIVSLWNDMTAHPSQAAQIRRPRRRPRDRVPAEWYDPAPEAGGTDPT